MTVDRRPGVHLPPGIIPLEIDPGKIIAEKEKMMNMQALKNMRSDLALDLIVMDKDSRDRTLFHVTHFATKRLDTALRDPSFMKYSHSWGAEKISHDYFNDSWTPDGGEHWQNYLKGITSLEHILPQKLQEHSAQTMDDFKLEAALLNVATGDHSEAIRIARGIFHPAQRAYALAQAASWCAELDPTDEHVVDYIGEAYQAFSDYNQLVNIRAAGMFNQLAPEKFPEPPRDDNSTPYNYYSEKFSKVSGSGNSNMSPDNPYSFERISLLHAKAYLANAGDIAAQESLRLDKDHKHNNPIFLGIKPRYDHIRSSGIEHREKGSRLRANPSVEEVFGTLRSLAEDTPREDTLASSYRWNIMRSFIDAGFALVESNSNKNSVLTTKYTLPPAPTQEQTDENAAMSFSWLNIAFGSRGVDSDGTSSYLNALRQSLAHAIRLPYSEERTELLAKIFRYLGKDDTHPLVTEKPERAIFDDLERYYRDLKKTTSQPV